MNKRTKKVLKPFYIFLTATISRMRCFRLGIKYKSGVRIKKHINISSGTKVVVSKNCTISNHVDFWGGGVIILGENTHIGSYSSLYSCKEGGITFGDNVNCARGLFIIDSNHGYKNKDVLICKQPMESAKITVGNNCWLGAHVTILKGVSIGNGCVVGAASLVNKKFGDNVVIAGNPAKIIKNR